MYARSLEFVWLIFYLAYYAVSNCLTLSYGNKVANETNIPGKSKNKTKQNKTKQNPQSLNESYILRTRKHLEQIMSISK